MYIQTIIHFIKLSSESVECVFSISIFTAIHVSITMRKTNLRIFNHGMEPKWSGTLNEFVDVSSSNPYFKVSKVPQSNHCLHKFTPRAYIKSKLWG